MYIEREALLKMTCAACRAYVKNAPAADVVEVVRCGECKRRDESAGLTHSVLCHYMGVVMPKDGFCSYGERRENP